MLKESEDMECEADVSPPHDEPTQTVNVSGAGDIDIEEEEKYWTELREIPQPGVKRKNDKGVYSEDEAEGRAPARKITPLELDFANLVVNKDLFYIDEVPSGKSSDIEVGSDCPDGKPAQPRPVLGDARQSSNRRIKMARRQAGDKNTNNTDNSTDNNPFQMLNWSESANPAPPCFATPPSKMFWRGNGSN